ncbi:MAG: BatD family protein [Saprospiraceae bacterium]|nr:BatD family protein [Saprospiraceae bacterium]
MTVTVDKDTVVLNEMIKVEFMLDNLTGNFVAPDFVGFQLVSGPNTSSSFMMVNGKVSQKKSYGYILLPTRTGLLKIGSASVEGDGNSIATEPINIQVEASGTERYSKNTTKKSYNYESDSGKDSIPELKKTKKRVLKKI